MRLDDFPTVPFRNTDHDLHGCTQRQLEQATRDGLLDRRARGVYTRADLEDSVDLRAMVIALAVTPNHVVVDRTAAWIHGVDLLTMGEHDALPPIEACAMRWTNPSRRAELDGRTRDLAPTDVMELDGLRVTTPLRTALDLGCHLHVRPAFAGMCMLARRHDFTAEDVVRELPRFKRRRGVIQLRALAPMVDPRVESVREAWTLIELRQSPFPRPTVQHWIEIDGVPTYRLDFAWVNAKVCIEYDGFDHHERTTAQREYDERRRAWLRANGWKIIVIRNGDFHGRGLRRWRRELSEALAPSYTNRRW